MSVKIEKGVPLPKANASVFASMQVGDSFHTDDIKIARSFRMFAYRNSPKWKIAGRKDATGTRFWRLT